MNRWLGSAVCLSLMAVLLWLPSTSQTRSNAQVERGKYLVVEVAHCGDCHTPMNEKGEPVQAKWLKGALLGFKPIAPMPWAEQSPNIVGILGWEQQDAVTFFTTGKYLGKSSRPPMPDYHLTRADAEAVVAYLRSLGPPER
jgi:fructose 5-dehydrogenase cytochrome subunit